MKTRLFSVFVVSVSMTWLALAMLGGVQHLAAQSQPAAALVSPPPPIHASDGADNQAHGTVKPEPPFPVSPDAVMPPPAAESWTGPLPLGPISDRAPGRQGWSQRPAPDDMVTVIVQLDRPSALTYRTAQSAGLHRRLTDAQFEDVQRYTTGLAQSHQAIQRLAREQGLTLAVKRAYFAVYNGFAAQMRWGDRAKLEALPGVAAVYLDGRVEGVLQETVPLIRADQVWADLGVRGEGIVVGMIDSGIDYTHPDLGGCLGSGCKVIGGYDFVNGDADPWDDAGHGTHTAGIVAADGVTMTGVAPGASLMALKVLGADNSGYWSDFLAALEYAVDPDGDPGTDDAPDLLSASIGGGNGDPNDPIAQAVDTVVAGGIPVIIAAGNAGPSYGTVQTPGGSRLAVTVGGSSKQDGMYWYSSRGDNAYQYIKPDVIAPGVSVCSTVPGGAYDCWNGTSMATPHVAGVVALLRQLHPDWTPAMLKAAVMGTAVDLGFDAFSQGAGRVDAYAAALTLGGFDPPSLHLGIVDPHASPWVVTTTLALRNLYTQTLTYTLSAGSVILRQGSVQGWPAGITATVMPTEAVLAPGAVATLTLQVDVDATRVPDVTDPPNTYEGRVQAQTDQGTVSAPFVFAKAPRLVIHYGDDPWMVMIHNRDTVRYDPPWNPGREV
ncbi:MAG: S8 family serine peptidase, partial [Anaerolineae bacterium]